MSMITGVSTDQTMEGTSKEIETKNDMVMIFHPPLSSQSYPWLVIRDGKRWERQIFYSITDNRCHVRSIPEMHNKYIAAASCKGWSVLVDNDTFECFLLNISTMERVQLPPTDVSRHRCCVLSSQDIYDSCRVLFFMRTRVRFRSCYIGDSDFIDHDLLIDSENGLFLMTATTFQGKLYVMTMYNHLLCADLTDPLLRFTTVILGNEIEELLPLYFRRTKHYLVESFGELFLIYKAGSDHELSDLKIYKADLGGKKWVPVENLGDRAVFIDACNCFIVSSAAASGLKGNAVYYVNKFGRNLFVYDIEDGTITTSLPCPLASHESALTWVYMVSQQNC